MSSTVKWWLIALVLFVPVVGLPLLWNAIEVQHDAGMRMTCNGHLCGRALAMLNYHDVHGHFPPAYLVGPDGKPWHSWRVLLLPYIEQQDLYKEYNFDEPWDGPNNSKLHHRMPRQYACPSDRDGLAAGRTNYFVVVGAATVFPGSNPLSRSDITRPLDRTILLVEATGQDIHWMEPRDLNFSEMNFETDSRNSPSISSLHRFPQVAFVYGTRSRISGFSPLELRMMLLAREEIH
jgi:hypothetical protein